MNSVRFLSARKYSNIFLKKIETAFNALFCIRRKEISNCLFLQINTNHNARARFAERNGRFSLFSKVSLIVLSYVHTPF